VYLPYHHLLFVRDYRKLLTAVCLFSSAQLEEKAPSSTTHRPAAAQEVTSHLKAELPELVPECSHEGQRGGGLEEHAELLAGEPRRAATPPCREGGAAPERCDQGAQAVAEEPAALRPAKKKAKGKAAVSNPDALEEGEETQMLRKIREANTELFSTRQRAEEAEAAEQSLLEELQRLDAELAGLVVPVLPAEGLPEGESLGLAYPVDEVLPAEGLPEGESLGLAYPVDDDLGLDGQQPLL